MYDQIIIQMPLFILCRSTFSDFAFRYGKDERFKSVEKMREREQLFTDYLAELKKLSKHKEHKSSKSTEDVVKHPVPYLCNNVSVLLANTKYCSF